MPPGLVPMARVMGSVAVVIVLPPASSTLTAGWVLQATPSVPPPGWVVKASLAGAPMVMVKLVLVAGQGGSRGRRLQRVAPDRAGDLAAGEGGHTAPGGRRGWRRSESAAPVPGWLLMLSVTFEANDVTTLPETSSTLTAGWVLQAAPSAPPPGWVREDELGGGPAVMVKVLLVAVLRPVARCAQRVGAGGAGDLAAGEGRDAGGGGHR